MLKTVILFLAVVSVDWATFLSSWADLSALPPSAPHARTPNLPPVAAVSATPVEAWVGQPIAFSSAGSMDPDQSPGPLQYFWDFGDGTTSNQANPSHAFGGPPRARRVILVVGDGADSATAVVTVFILAPPTARRPAFSGLVALAQGDTELWVANPDSDSVSVHDVAAVTPVKIAEIPVGRHPRTLAVSLDGTQVFVSCQGVDELWAIDRAGRRVARRVAVGRQPYGVAVAPVTGDVLVSNQGDDTLSILSPTLAPRAVLPLADGPRSVTVTADGTRAYVSHFLTRGNEGTITEVDLRTLTVARIIGLAEDPGPDSGSSGRGFPNMLSALAVDPAGLSVWAGGLKSNTGRGLFVNGQPLTPENRTRGLMSRIEIAGGVEDMARRIDPDDADSIAGIAFSPTGRYAYVTHQGAGFLSVFDVSAATLVSPGDGAPVPFVSRIDLGHAPQAIVTSADGKRGYVANYLSRNVTVLNLSDPKSPQIVATIQTTAESLSPSVANGKKLFYRSRGPRHSKDNYIACASCHADGGMGDGRTWDLTQIGEGLRNTIDLRGRGGMDHGPVHWSANFDEIQDFENDIVHGFGGTGLAEDGMSPNPPLGTPNGGRSLDLDDLAAYVASLKVAPPSPVRKSGSGLSDAARRGKSLFFDPALKCSTCHVPPRFTDSVPAANPAAFVLHDVGTLTAASGKRLGGALPGVDTPSLIGLWDSAPYLHDGSAATLTEVLTTKNSLDKHGVTSGLTAQQRLDLVEYLLSIDGTPDDPPPAGSGGKGGSCGATGLEAVLFLGALLAIRRNSGIRAR